MVCLFLICVDGIFVFLWDEGLLGIGEGLVGLEIEENLICVYNVGRSCFGFLKLFWR